MDEYMSDVIQKQMKEIILKKFLIKTRRYIPRVILSSLKLDFWMDVKLDTMVTELVAMVAGTTVKTLDIKYPKDWKEAFKERWFPKWAKKRWPVKYEQKTWDANAIFLDIRTDYPGQDIRIVLQQR